MEFSIIFWYFNISLSKYKIIKGRYLNSKVAKFIIKSIPYYSNKRTKNNISNLN